jgi:hypothetical protein
VGDEAALRRASAQDAGWVHRAGGPLNLPPLVAVTHSSLLRLPAFRERLRACARYLLEAGASANQSAGNRWPPASLEAPDEAERLSALYGAAGQNHDAELTRLLLAAGADPNDNESLYHSLDHSLDHLSEQPSCTRLLLEAGARVTGSNALYRELDLDDVGTLRLLLAHGADANEPAAGPPTSDWGTPLLWAIRRRRSPAHIEALLAAGADPAATTPDGTPAHRVALRFGLTEVARLLEAAGGGAPLPPDEAFVAACARGDEAAARLLLSRHPGLIDMRSTRSVTCASSCCPSSRPRAAATRCERWFHSAGRSRCAVATSTARRSTRRCFAATRRSRASCSNTAPTGARCTVSATTRAARSRGPR